MGIDENSIDTNYFKPKKDLVEIKDYCSESNSNDDFVINPTSFFFGCRAEANLGDLAIANEKLKNTSIFNNQITLSETEEEKNLDQFNKKDKKRYLMLYILKKTIKYSLKMKSTQILWISLNHLISIRKQDLKLNSADLQTRII